MDYRIERRQQSAQATVAVHLTSGWESEAVGAVLAEAFPEVWAYLEGIGVHPAGPPFARYTIRPEGDLAVEAGFPVPEPVPGAGRVVPGDLPGGLVAATWHVGPYDTLEGAHHALEAHLSEHDRTPAGPRWEVYWTDPGEEPDPANWRTEVVAPLA